MLLSGSGNAFSANRQDSAAIIPILALLLGDDGSISLRVGQQIERVFDSERYANGLKIRLGRVYESVDVTINGSDIPTGTNVEIYLNGILYGELENGSNTVRVPASDAKINEIEIRLKNGAPGTWAIGSLAAFISDALRGPRNRAEAQRFLTRATFGARVSEMDLLMQIGYEAWLDRQIATPMTNSLAFMDQAVKDRLANRRQRLINEGETNPDVLNSTFLGRSQESVSRTDSWFHAAINGQDQLRQRMAYALSQILVVGDEFGDSGNRNRAYAGYHDVLAKNALGNYRTLLKDVTINPAMAQWLSLRGSQRTGRPGALRSQPDENYAREIQQLFTIGLVQLNMDGTVKMGNDGQPIETYTPEIVSEFARVFTGWMWVTRPTGGPILGWETTPLVPWGGEPNNFHDYGEKTLLDYPGASPVSPAGLTTEGDLDRALDNLFEHPNVAPFISKQLIQRLVTSNPSKEYVSRVANVFQNTDGVKGNLAAVAKAILLDQEALTSHTRSTGGKLKEPLLRFTQLWRTFEARTAGRYIRFSLPERTAGQRPIGAVTVFNYYPPDYAPKGAIEDAGLVAPEFLLTGDGLLVSYLNKLAQLARSADFGDTHPLYSASFNLPMILNTKEAESIAHDLDALMDLLNERLLGGLMTPGLRSALITYLEDLPEPSTDAQHRESIVEEALIMLTASPEYSVQR